MFGKPDYIHICICQKKLDPNIFILVFAQKFQLEYICYPISQFFLPKYIYISMFYTKQLFCLNRKKENRKS